jgi:hypothetical protein
MRLNNLKKSAICAFGLAVVWFGSFVSKASALKEPDLLARQIKATAIKGESLDQVLHHLAIDYQIPLGIELGDPNLTPSRKIELDLPDTSLKDFLDAAVAKDPRYTWKLEGGVIHVWPVSGRDTLLATLLGEKISHFAFIGEATRYAVCNDIMNLPEIRSKLVIAGVDPMIFANFSSIHKFDKKTFFNESNLTLKELLDRIVLKTDMKRWVLVRWGEKGEFITLRS